MTFSTSSPEPGTSANLEIRNRPALLALRSLIRAVNHRFGGKATKLLSGGALSQIAFLSPGIASRKSSEAKASGVIPISDAHRASSSVALFLSSTTALGMPPSMAFSGASFLQLKRQLSERSLDLKRDLDDFSAKHAVLQLHVASNVLQHLKDFVIEAHLRLVLVPLRFIVVGHRFTTAFGVTGQG